MISVKDLIEGRKTDASSSLQLCGRLSTITTATTSHHQRGSILLSDILTGDAIPCQVDRMFHDLQDTPIAISQWTFIVFGNGLHCLQFTMDYVKRFGSSSTLYDERILATRTFLRLLKDSSSSDFSCLHPRQLATTYPGDIPYGVSLSGLLCAKSILYIKQGSESCFFAELKDIYQLHSSTCTSSFTAKAYQWTVPVVFKGDQLIKYYMDLQVGRYYLFNNLQATTMTTFTPRPVQQQRQQQQQPKHIKRSVLSFEVLSSSFLELPKEQCQYLLSTYNPTDSDNTSFDVDMPNPAAVATAASQSTSETPIMPLSNLVTSQNKLHHYTGVVTRVIDPLFGVYELDKQILLCLFHYIGYSENCPYRIGTKLKISHAHVLSLDSLSTVSPILDMDWKAPRMTRLFDPDEENDNGDYSDTNDDTENNNKNNAGNKTPKQQSMRYILVACMRSDVRITTLLELSDDARRMMNSGANPSLDLEQRHIKDMVYAHCVGRHLTFAAMIRQLELFESMKKKFGKLLGGGGGGEISSSHGSVSPLIWLGKQLIEVVFSTTGNRSTHEQGDLYGDFFQHGSSCLAVNESTNTTGNVTLDACPTLRHLISTILNNNDNDDDEDSDGLSYKLAHVPLIEIPPSFVTSHAGVTRYCYDAKTKDTAWVVGLVEALPDGQVYFIDDTYRIKLLVATIDNVQQVPSSRWKNTGRLRLGHVYIIKRFHLVMESWTLSGIAGTLDQQYMMCDYQDMKVLGPFTSSIPATINSTTTILYVQLPIKKEDLLRLSYFDLTLVDKNTSLDISIYVALEIMPTLMKKDDNGVVSLEKWVRAMQYGFGTRVDPKVVYLVFTSNMGGLSYAGHLQVGTWFGLTLMNDADQATEPAPGGGDNAHNTKYTILDISPKIPIFIVDRSKHQFYPMVYQHRYPRFHQHEQLQQQKDANQEINMVFIHPVFGAKTEGPSSVVWEVWVSLAPALNIVDAIKVKSTLKRQHDQMNDDNDNDDDNDNKETNSMITLYGTVLFKGFIIDDNNVETGLSNTQLELFQRLGVGFGRKGVKVFLRLQQVNGLETADIYLGGDLHHLANVIGVIPGNKMTLFRVDRKQSGSSGKVYFIAGSYTFIETYPQLGKTLFDDLLDLGNRTCVRQFTLDRMLPSSSGNDADVDTDIFQAAVSIHRIEKIKLQWVCTLCGMEWYQNKCYGNCGEDGRQIFRAEAKVQVTDGTSIVLAMIDGESLVFRLLMLLPSQEETLKQAALLHGSLECGFWVDGQDDFDTNMMSMADAALRNGMTLADLGIRIKLHGQFHMYGKRYYQRSSTTTTAAAAAKKKDGCTLATDRPRMDGLGLHQRIADDQDPPLRALAYPIIKVKVESLEVLDPEQQAWELIERLSSS